MLRFVMLFTATASVLSLCGCNQGGGKNEEIRNFDRTVFDLDSDIKDAAKRFGTALKPFS
jgi:hypothetical protein